MLTTGSKMERARNSICWLQRWRDKLWWSGNSDGIEGVEISVKKLCENVIKVQRKSDRVMAMVLVFEEEVTGVICAYAPQIGRSECKKDQFYNDMASEWDL